MIDYFGVPPEKVVDVQALAGNSTDNVPGAKGIGVKTAAQLINEYGDLDTLLARAGEIKQPKRREVLTDPASVALIRTSERLVKLVDDAPLEIPLDDLGLHQPDGKTLVSFLQAMEFTQLTRRAAEIYGVEANEIEPDPAFVGPAGWRGRNGEVVEASAEPAPAPTAAAAPAAAAGEIGGFTPAALAEARREEGVATTIDRSLYETVTTLERLDAWIAEAFAAGVVAMDTETTSLDPMSCDLVGASLATAPGRACYIPLQHVSPNAADLLGGEPAPAQIPLADAIARLKPLLEARGVLKIAHNMKYDLLVLARYGIDVAPIEDTMLISYVLDAGRNNHGLDELSKKHLGHECIPFSAVAGSGRTFIGFARVPLDKATEYAAEDSDVALRLWRMLKPRLAAEHMASAYATLERPMVGVLAAMERRGVAIDRNILSRLSGEFAQDMARLEADIYELAGETFNLGSPKQLGDILFGRMGLPGAKKTATGAWSTSASVLDELAESGNTFAARILDWRQLSKLKSTYTDALPSFVNKETHRVHTSYALAATTTGRLSSSEPNLQNIPVRNEAGRKIRKAFVAEPGNALISADYSQIELRLLAHIADIPQLRQAFAEGIDIHAMTAAKCSACRCKACLRMCAAAPRRSISASSTAFPPSASPISSPFRARRRRPISSAISSASPAFAAIWTRRRRSCARPASSPPSSAANAIFRASPRRMRQSAPSSSAPRSMRPFKARPPTSSAAPWRAWMRRSRMSGSMRACCCKCMTNWCSRRRWRRPRRRSASSSA